MLNKIIVFITFLLIIVGYFMLNNNRLGSAFIIDGDPEILEKMVININSFTSSCFGYEKTQTVLYNGKPFFLEINMSRVMKYFIPMKVK